MELENVLKEVGGFGLFNKSILMTALMLGTWHATFCYFGQLFIHITPASQWCFPNGTSSGSTLNVSSLPRGRCQVMTSLQDGGYATLPTNSGDVVTCSTGWVYDNEEIFTTATMENQWVCGNSWKMYTIHTAYFVGSIVGYLTSGVLADKIGRKKTILMLLLTGATGNLLGVFFPQHASFAAFRSLAGIGSDTVCTTLFVVVIEYTVAEKRTLCAFIWAINWTLLACVLPWYTYFLQSWRGLLITNTCVDVVLAVILCCWVPESSSWLLSVGRKKEALEMFQKIAKFNGKQVSQEQLSRLLERPAVETDGQATTATKQAPGFLESTFLMLKSPRIRRTTILVYLGCFATSLCYNSNALELGRLGLNIYSTYSIAIAFEFPSNVICILALDTLGRRWPNSVFTLLGGITSILMGLLHGGPELLTMTLAVVTVMCFSGGYNVTFQLAFEVFPTVIRGRAVLLQRLMGDVGALLGAQVASLAEYDDHLPLLVAGGISLAASVALFFVPDPVNLALPQTIEDGENFGRDQGICFCPLFVSIKARKRRKSVPTSFQLGDRDATLPADETTVVKPPSPSWTE